MELPYHQNEALKLLKRRLRKRNMAAVVEILLKKYDPDILETSIKMAEMAGLYQPIENGDGKDND